VFSVWQSGKTNGAELFNQPTSMGWTELATRDMAAAKGFYTKVFPWTAKTNDMGGAQEYTEWLIDGRSIGGSMTMGSMYPANVPAHWLVYFVVADTDATVKRAQELGAKLTAPAIDIPQGRMAVLTDPQGAAFAVIKLNQ
jgi:predicted enzyme related to lactoylglutathione lyase